MTRIISIAPGINCIPGETRFIVRLTEPVGVMDINYVDGTLDYADVSKADLGNNTYEVYIPVRMGNNHYRLVAKDPTTGNISHITAFTVFDGIVHPGDCIFEQAGEVVLYPAATGVAEATFNFPQIMDSLNPIYMVANITEMDGHTNENQLWHVTATALNRAQFHIKIKNEENNNGTYVKVSWIAKAF